MSNVAAPVRRRPLGWWLLAVALLALVGCGAGASDRAPNGSALGADSSRMLKAKPTADLAGGAPRPGSA